MKNCLPIFVCTVDVSSLIDQPLNKIQIQLFIDKKRLTQLSEILNQSPVTSCSELLVRTFLGECRVDFIQTLSILS